MEDLTVARFHRRWWKRHRINKKLKRWLHLMSAVVAKLGSTPTASGSARCITQRWRQLTRRLVAIAKKKGSERSSLICLHVVAIKRVQESVAHDISTLCTLFAQLLRGEVSLNAFAHAAESFFRRRQQHLTMLTNSVGRLMHLQGEVWETLHRDLPGARRPMPYPMHDLVESCKTDAGPLDSGSHEDCMLVRNHSDMDASTLITYIQRRHQEEIDSLCSALERTLNGAIDLTTFQNMCFVYSGKAQCYREIMETMVAQKMRGPKSHIGGASVPSSSSDESSDGRTKDLEIASTSSMNTNDSWL